MSLPTDPELNAIGVLTRRTIEILAPVVQAMGEALALIEGFNPNVELTRTQTLMGGASHCDSRYRFRRRPAAGP